MANVQMQHSVTGATATSTLAAFTSTWQGLGWTLVGGGGTPPPPTSTGALVIGTGAPSNSVGVNGALYIDTNAWVIYGPKASGVWPGSGVALAGDSVSGFTIRDVVATAANLPTDPEPATGDAYKAEDTDHYHVWNGDEYVDIGLFGGSIGTPGPSAYELAVSEGFVGTLGQWLESLQGDPGPPGDDAPPGEGTGLLQVATTDVDVVSTAGASPGVDMAAYVAPAGSLIGKVLRLSAHCTLLNNSGGNVAFQAKVRAGSAEATSNNANLATGTDRRSYPVMVEFIAQGDSSVQVAIWAMLTTSAAFTIGLSAGSAHPWLVGVFDLAVDLTAEQTFSLRFQHAGAASTVDATCEASYWEVVVPADLLGASGLDEVPYAGTSAWVPVLSEATWSSLGTAVTEAGGGRHRQYADLEEYSSYAAQAVVLQAHADARLAVVYSDDDGDTWRYLSDGTAAAGGSSYPAGNVILATSTTANPRLTNVTPTAIHDDAKKVVILGVLAWMTSGSATVQAATVTVQLFR